MRWLIGSMVAVLALSGCHANPSPLAATARQAGAKVARSVAADPYPVTVGSKWEYVLHQKQPDGSVHERPMSMAITSAKTRDNGIVEAVLERQYQSWAPPATRVMHYPDKVVLSRLSDPEDGPSMTIMRLPFAADAKWPGRPFGGGNSETVHVIGEEAVTVPAGSFKAFRVDHEITYAQGGTDTLNYWYAPGVGCVKMIERTTLWQGDTPIHMEVTGDLSSYVIGPESAKTPGSAAK
jgi:hypothetical protein